MFMSVTGVNGVQCASDHVVSLVFNCGVTGVIGAKGRQGGEPLRCRMLMRETCELLLGADEDQDLGDAGDGDDARDGEVDDGDRE